MFLNVIKVLDIFWKGISFRLNDIMFLVYVLNWQHSFIENICYTVYRAIPLFFLITPVFVGKISSQMLNPGDVRKHLHWQTTDAVSTN